MSEVTLHHFTYAAAVNCKLMRDALGGKVNAIVAYKLDELTTNRVCRGMVTGVGGGKKYALFTNRYAASTPLLLD